MNEERVYLIDLKVGLEFKGEDLPCEETLLTPIKTFMKNHIKGYKNTTRIIAMDTKMFEGEYAEADTEET